MIGIMQE